MDSLERRPRQTHLLYTLLYSIVDDLFRLLTVHPFGPLQDKISPTLFSSPSKE